MRPSFVAASVAACLFCVSLRAGAADAPAAAAAVEPKKAEPKKYDWGGQVRVRNEDLFHYNSFVPSITAIPNNAMILLRARLNFLAQPIDAVKAYIQPQFSRTYAQEESTVANGTFIDDFDLHQGYMEFPHISESPVTLKVGRQELSYGDERLIGAFDWSNIGRAFDAAKIRLEWDHLWSDLFGAWIQSAGGNRYFFGWYTHWEPLKQMTWEPYVLLLTDNDGGQGGGSYRLVTIGQRLMGNVGRWDLGTEEALQTGTSGSNSIFAYALHAHAGYTFDAGWSPRLAPEFNLASGTSTPGTGTVRTFNNLYPTNHDKYGYMDLVSWQNMMNPGLTFRVTPLEGLRMTLGYQALMVFQPNGGLFQANGSLMRAGSPTASRFVGNEIDFLTTYRWNKWASFLGGASYLKAGPFLKDTGVARDAYYLYVQAQVDI